MIRLFKLKPFPAALAGFVDTDAARADKFDTVSPGIFYGSAAHACIQTKTDLFLPHVEQTPFIIFLLFFVLDSVMSVVSVSILHFKQ